MPDGLIVYTTPSSKSTVKIKECSCKTNEYCGRWLHDWSCAKDGHYYCPGCDQILCCVNVSAPYEEVENSFNNGEYDIKWICTECSVYVFEMNPITSTALVIGLPILIEKAWEDYESPTG